MIDRETRLQIGVSVVAVGIFIALAAVVSANFGVGSGVESHLSELGGFALVAGVAAFVLIATLGGLWLARTEFETGESGEDAADGA